MRQLRALLLTELKFQWRHGFVAAAIAIVVVWVALLSLLPPEPRPFWFGIITAVDVTSIGLLFGFGLGILDSDQGPIYAIRLTPVPAWLPAVARGLSLSLLIVVSLAFLGGLIMPVATVLSMLPGVLLCAVFFSFMGVTAARRLATVNQFMVFFALSGVIWAVPVLYYAGLVDSPAWLLLPSAGAMVFLQLGFTDIPAPLLGAALAMQAGWIAAAFLLGERWAPRLLSHRFGGH